MASRNTQASANGVTRRWTLASGLDVSGDEWGEPDVQPVVLLNGGGQTRHAWKGLGTKLAAAGYRAVALDARGHGDSDWSADGVYTEDLFMADLADVVAQLGDHRPVLVGASLGGGTALLAVGEGHVDPRALVLVDIAPTVERAGADRIPDFMRPRPEGFGSIEEAAPAVAEYIPHRPRPARTDGLVKNLRLGDDGRYRWHWDPGYINRVFDLEARERRMSAAARNLDVPTLLVRGGKSDVLSEEGAREFRELCVPTRSTPTWRLQHTWWPVTTTTRSPVLSRAFSIAARRRLAQNGADRVTVRSDPRPVDSLSRRR